MLKISQVTFFTSSLVIYWVYHDQFMCKEVCSFYLFFFFLFFFFKAGLYLICFTNLRQVTFHSIKRVWSNLLTHHIHGNRFDNFVALLLTLDFWP